LFWDYPGRRLSLARDRELVVRRILAEGGLQHGGRARAPCQHLGDVGARRDLGAAAAALTLRADRLGRTQRAVLKELASWVREAARG
jgi:hypothetical protein